MENLQIEDVAKPSFCLDGLGWTLLELTDALRPLEKVPSKIAELIRLHVNTGCFLSLGGWVTSPTETCSKVLCPCIYKFV